MPVRRMFKFLVGVTVVLCTSYACGDPGFRMRPIGWDKISNNEWSKQFGDFSIQSRGIEGLIGHDSIDPNLQVRSNSKPILVESASLITATGTLPGRIYGDVIPPSTSSYHLPIEWVVEHDRPAYEVLGSRCEIHLLLKVGTQPRDIRIEYEKY